MPYKKKYNKKRAPRRGRKYPRYRSPNMQGHVSGMPLTRTAHMRYCEQLTLQSTFGTLTNHRFRANGIFDPDQTGGGHQPMGHDQWAELYNHYVVIGAKINVTATLRGSTDKMAVGIFLDDGHSSLYGEYTSFLEAKRGSQRILALQRNSVRMNTTFSAKKFFNITDIKDNIKHLGAAVGSDPTDEAYFNIYAQDILANTTNVDFLICIDYIVSYSEPKTLTPS